MLKRFWNWLLSDVTETSTVSTSEPKQGTSPEQGSAGNSWWQRSNAAYFRDNGSMDLPIRNVPVASFCHVFGPALDEYFKTCGNWRLARDFRDIHVALLSVEVFGLHENWNRRDINLKPALLIGLKNSYAEYAAHRGIDLSRWRDVLVIDTWLCRDSNRDTDVLVLEVPYTTFSVQYPHLAAVLATEEYWTIRRSLEQTSKV